MSTYNRISAIFFFAIFRVILGQMIVPMAPDNIVCFPERDFCAVENFWAYRNSRLELRVVRGTGTSATTVGSAVGVVSGGAVAFEVNHPGGLCWGDGTNIKVTPDIKAGDTIQLLNGQSVIASSVIQDGYVTDTILNGNVYTVNGRIGASVNRNLIEVVVVNPALRETNIGRRVVIATPLPTSEPTYDSIITFGIGGTFTATFTFKDGPTQNAVLLAEIVHTGGGESLSMWVADVGSNSQSVTISEFGQVGGPVSPLCPPGPTAFGNPEPAQVIVYGKSVLWSPAVIQPGALSVDNYEFLVDTPPANGVTIQNGYRVQGPLTRVNDAYTYITAASTTCEFISSSGNYGYSKYIDLRTKTAGTAAITLTFNPAGAALGLLTGPTRTSSFTITSNTNQIVYTLDGSSPLSTLADGSKVVSSTAIIYTGPVTITSAVTVNAAALDKNGKSLTGSVKYNAAAATGGTAPGQVTGVSARLDFQGIYLTWKPIVNDPTFRSYTIKMTKSGLSGTTTTTVTTQLPYIARNLVIGSSYSFTVAATNMYGTGNPSAATPALLMKQVDRLVSTPYDWIVDAFDLRGTSTTANAKISLFRANADGSRGAAFSVTTDGVQTTSIADIPQPDGTYLFNIRIRGLTVRTPENPLPQIYIVSDKGGVLGPTY